MQGSRREGCTATGFAIQQDLEVTCLQCGVGTELEFQHAARDMHSAAQVACGKLICLAHIDQNIGFANGLFGVLKGNFLHAGFGCGYEVVGGFHISLRFNGLSKK
jgi:hypothetical protein